MDCDEENLWYSKKKICKVTTGKQSPSGQNFQQWFSRFIEDRFGDDYLKNQDEFYVPKKYLTDKNLSVFLTGVFYTNTKTRSNLKNAKAALFHDIQFAQMKSPLTNESDWPLLTKTLMGIKNDVNFKAYRPAKSEIVGEEDDYKIMSHLFNVSWKKVA